MKNQQACRRYRNDECPQGAIGVRVLIPRTKLPKQSDCRSVWPQNPTAQLQRASSAGLAALDDMARNDMDRIVGGEVCEQRLARGLSSPTFRTLSGSGQGAGSSFGRAAP